MEKNYQGREKLFSLFDKKAFCINMKISVVIVCYNEEKNIGGCLDSLLAQTYSPEMYEIIIVDNNSCALPAILSASKDDLPTAA